MARDGRFVHVTMPLEHAFDSSLHPHSSNMKPKTGQTEEQHQQVFKDEVKYQITKQRIADAMKELLQLARFVDESESGLPAFTRFTTAVLAAYNDLVGELAITQLPQTPATTPSTSAVLGLIATALAAAAAATSLSDVAPRSPQSRL